MTMEEKKANSGNDCFAKDPALVSDSADDSLDQRKPYEEPTVTKVSFETLLSMGVDLDSILDK